MLDTVIRHSSSPYLSIFDRIQHCLPTLQSFPPPTIRTVQQIQIYVVQPTLSHTILDSLSRRIIAGVGLQLGREPQILSSDFFICLDEFADRRSNFSFVGIPFCRIDSAIANFESSLHGGRGFTA